MIEKNVKVSSLIFVASTCRPLGKAPLAHLAGSGLLPLHPGGHPADRRDVQDGRVRFPSVVDVPIFPDQLSQHADMLLGFALLTILWGAFLALRQTDLKKLLAFSSLNHVAYCTGHWRLAWPRPASNLRMPTNWRGRVSSCRCSHGLSAAGLFYLVGLLEQRAGHRDRDGFGGLCSVTPRFAAMFYILTFCSLGLPFLAGFAAEFLIFSGSFAVAPKVTAVATLGLLATAVFLLTMLQRVFTGPVNEQRQSMPDLTRNEILILTPILILVFWAGIYPKTWLALRFGVHLEFPRRAGLRTHAGECSPADPLGGTQPRRRLDLPCRWFVISISPVARSPTKTLIGFPH